MNNKHKQKRIELINETIHVSSKGSYIVGNKEIEINSLSEYMTMETQFYSKKADVNHACLPKYDHNIKVVEEDSLYCGEKLLKEGLKVAVLNMASYSMPGGGVLKGSHAQEEEIFLRTDLWKSLYQFHDIGKQYGINKRNDGSYPLNIRYGAIYTPRVTVFRYGQDKNYEFLEEPFRIDIVSVPALKNTEEGKISELGNEIMTTKIKQMLDVALLNGNDAIVLSAFGCGAYHNDPTNVAKLFANVLAEDYGTFFKNIRFAILDNYKTNNYKVFKTIFG